MPKSQNYSRSRFITSRDLTVNSISKSTVRMSGVRVVQNGSNSSADIFNYKIKYTGMQALAPISFVDTIILCVSGGRCLPAISTTNGALSNHQAFDAPGSGPQNSHSGGERNNVVGDFNGDGKADMLAYTGSNGVWAVCLSTGVGFDCQNWRGHGGGEKNNAVGDFNGDSKMDMAGYTGSNGMWAVCLSTGIGFNCQNWQGHGGGESNNAVGDFNGDGRMDMAGYAGNNGVWAVCLSTGVGFNCQSWQGHSGGEKNNIVGDFNGDGRSDMMGYTG
jgi:hypothetical protein